MSSILSPSVPSYSVYTRRPGQLCPQAAAVTGWAHRAGALGDPFTSPSRTDGKAEARAGGASGRCPGPSSAPSYAGLCLPDPDWASYTLGVFICLSCSGIHRNIPQVSKVKSVLLDTWEDAQVEVPARGAPGNCPCTGVGEAGGRRGWGRGQVCMLLGNLWSYRHLVCRAARGEGPDSCVLHTQGGLGLGSQDTKPRPKERPGPSGFCAGAFVWTLELRGLVFTGRFLTLNGVEVWDRLCLLRRVAVIVTAGFAGSHSPAFHRGGGTGRCFPGLCLAFAHGGFAVQSFLSDVVLLCGSGVCRLWGGLLCPTAA